MRTPSKIRRSRFTVARTSGKTASGQLRNALGTGFTGVDGSGLIDAEQAVVGR